MTTDASGVAIRLALFQTTMSNEEIRRKGEEKNDLSMIKTLECVGLFSRVLKPPETRYSIIEREFLSIVDSLNFFTN
jgi:RNase H-like domain found in reverse transcriptase